MLEWILWVFIGVIICIAIRYAYFLIKTCRFYRKREFNREFKKKCLNTTPCQCCAYWNVRKDRCELEYKLLRKYKLEEK